MATNVLASSAFCCLNTQVALDNLTATPAGRIQQTGFISALSSGNNMRGFEQVTNSVKDNRRRAQSGQTPPTVEVKVIKPSCSAGTVATTASDICGTGTPTVDPYDYLEPAVTKVASMSGSMTKDEFRELCDSPDERRVIVLRQFAQEIMYHVNKELIKEAYAVMGDYADGTLSTGGTTRDIPIINTLGHLNAGAFATLTNEAREQGFNARPIHVGGQKMGVGMDVLKFGGTGDSIGADGRAAMSAVEAYYDNHIDAEVRTLQGDVGTESYGMTWIPGGMQMLNWFENKGMFEEFKEDYANTTLTIDGMEFDYKIRYNECNRLWEFSLQVYYDLFFIPDALYTCKDGNGKWLNRLTCGDVDCSIF